MTLLILAAGMGSRYGGLKQLDPITDKDEFIIDFSVYDAIVSGFDKVVFVIKEENLDLFRETIGKRFEDKVKVEYAFQKLADLPNGYTVPEGREKPWGTAHAVLSARGIINERIGDQSADIAELTIFMAEVRTHPWQITFWVLMHHGIAW